MNDSRTNDKPISVIHVLEILIRQKWTILTIVFVIFSIVAIYTFTQKKIYEAYASVIVKDNSEKFGASAKTPEDKLNNLQNQYEILNSRDLLQPVAEKILHRTFADSSANKDTMEIIKNAGLLKSNLLISENLLTEGIIKELKNSMSLHMNKETSIIKIFFRSTDPVEAAIIANIFVDTYHDRDLQRSRADASELRKFLETQVKNKSAQLGQTDSALQNYMQGSGTPEPQTDGTMLAQRISGIEAELESNEIEYQKSKHLLDSYQKELKRMGPNFTKKLINVDDIYIQELQKTIARKEAEKDISKVIGGNQNPAVQKEFARTNKTIDSLKNILQERTRKYIDNSIESYSIAGNNTSGVNDITFLSGEIQRLKLKVESLEISKNELYDNLVKYSARLNKLPKQSITLAKLQRDRQFTENISMDIGKRYEEAKLNELSTFGQIDILDKASVPLEPVSPDVKLNLLLALLSGISLGLIAAFVLNGMNNRVHSPEDIDSMGLRLLSTIPRLKLEKQQVMRLSAGSGLGSTDLVVAGDPRSEIYEAFLRLGVNVIYNNTGNKRKTILITSAAPGAGKSATAINLAITLANLEKNVLLVDTDLRRPVIHKFFKKPITPGLTDYLLENNEIYEIIQPTSVKGLDIITCGRRIINTSLTLSSGKMKDFISDQNQQYDFIIYDAPPLNPITDAIHIARYVDEVILIARAGLTNVREIRVAQSQLEHVGIFAGGVVLNEFDPSDAPFSYGKQYGYNMYNDEPERKKYLRKKNA